MCGYKYKANIDYWLNDVCEECYIEYDNTIVYIEIDI